MRICVCNRGSLPLKAGDKEVGIALGSSLEVQSRFVKRSLPRTWDLGASTRPGLSRTPRSFGPWFKFTGIIVPRDLRMQTNLLSWDYQVHQDPYLHCGELGRVQYYCSGSSSWWIVVVYCVGVP